MIKTSGHNIWKNQADGRIQLSSGVDQKGFDKKQIMNQKRKNQKDRTGIHVKE